MLSFLRPPITGPKAFAIFASFFVVIIAVNLYMAFQAVRTFPGLEVANSYVASQSFDADRAAQEALGWTAQAGVHEGELRLHLTDPAGAPVGDSQAAVVSAIFGRPTQARDDQFPSFAFTGEYWAAPISAAPGEWRLRLQMRSAGGTLYRKLLHVSAE